MHGGQIFLVFFIISNAIFSSFSELMKPKSNDLKSHYVVLMIEEIPFLFKNETGHYEGYAFELMNEIAKKLNFTFEIKVPDDKKYGTFENGSWNGLMKELLEKRGDIISGAFTITSERSNYIDFTVPFYGFSGMTIVTKKEKATNDLFSFANVFSWKVWLTVGIVIIGFGILVYVLERFSPFSSINTKNELVQNQIKYDLKESFWLSLGTITLAGAEDPPHTISTRLLLSGFWMFSAILISTYQANLSAYLTITRLETPVSSLKELANQHKIKYSIVAGTSVQTYFNEMRLIEETFFEYWKKSSLIPQNPGTCDIDQQYSCKTLSTVNLPDSIFGTLQYKSSWEYPLTNTYSTLIRRIEEIGYLNSTGEGIERVLNSPAEEPFALIVGYPIALYETNKNCDLKLIGNQFSSRPYAIGVEKNSSLKNMISDVILILQRDLILDNLKAKWWNQNTECMSNSNSDTSISIMNVGGALITMAGALVLSFIILFIDMVNKRTKFKPKPSKNRPNPITINNNTIQQQQQ